MSEVRIEKVKTGKELKRFVFFPWKIYKDDPNWVPPLVMDFKDKLDRKKNPFFEHAEMDLFLAHRGQEITGRISAILDENHNSFHNEKVVFFGLYESFNDSETASALLNTVAEWGKRKGMTVIRGPMNLSMNDECAFLLEGFDSPPAVMMPYNPPYYLELMEKCGLTKAKDLNAYLMSRDYETAAKVRAVSKQFQDQMKVTVRCINMKKLEEEAKKIQYIYNNAWEKNWGFVPWTQKEMDHIVKKLKQLADPGLVILAEDENRPVGFAFALPNFNEVIKKMNGRLTPLGIFKYLFYRKRIKGLRAVAFGVLKEFRQTGLSYLLFAELEKNALKRGYEWGELSWQLEDNEAVNRLCASLGGKIYKKYRIFEKKIV